MGNNKIKKSAYFIGIKGVGMTMLAQFLKGKGYEVSGSDYPEVFLTDKVLKENKIKVFSNFSKDNIDLSADLIIYSTAYNEENNIEIKYLKNLKDKEIRKKIFTYAQALAEVFNKHYGISVCGSHGKTTVSAFLGYVLNKSGLSPNVLVGSRVPQFKGSTLVGKSKIFVAETDEYQNKLQYFYPQAVLLNNIDYDHPDFFKDGKAYLKVFKDYVKKIPKKGFLVLNNGDKNNLKAAKACQAKIISYDLVEDYSTAYKKETVNFLAYNLKIKNNKQIFQVNNLGEFKISLFGKHNVLNALAVIATSLELGIKIEEIKKHLVSFKGTERRAQILGKHNQAIIIDDYAHHPSEVKASLNAFRSVYKNKNLITVFHPHTFTRTKALFSDFVQCFRDSDELIILDIYGSAREKRGGVSSEKLVAKIKEVYKKEKISRKVRNIKTISLAAKYLKNKINKDDVLILMGAGDVFRLYKELKK